MTELERRICELQAEMDSINADKAKADKITEDIYNQLNMLDSLIGARITREESISDLVSKKKDLAKELEANNVWLGNILDRLKKIRIKSMNLFGNMLF